MEHNHCSKYFRHISFMQYYKIRNILLQLLLISLVCIACSQSDAQREFEREAFRTPQNITEMTQDGDPVTGGMTDPDDWRIGPDFRGLLDVETAAYPNPAQFNGNFFIELDLGFANTVSGLLVFAFQDPTRPPALLQDLDEASLATFTTLTLTPSSFANSGGVGGSPVYRIIITDRNENVITYGDIEVE